MIDSGVVAYSDPALSLAISRIFTCQPGESFRKRLACLLGSPRRWCLVFGRAVHPVLTLGGPGWVLEVFTVEDSFGSLLSLTHPALAHSSETRSSEDYVGL